MTTALVNAGRHLISNSIQPHVDRCRVNATYQNMVSLVNQISPVPKECSPSMSMQMRLLPLLESLTQTQLSLLCSHSMLGGKIVQISWRS